MAVSGIELLWFEVAVYRYMRCAVSVVLGDAAIGGKGVGMKGLTGPEVHRSDHVAREEAIDRLVRGHVIRRQEFAEGDKVAVRYAAGALSLSAWLLANPPVEFEVKKPY